MQNTILKVQISSKFYFLTKDYIWMKGVIIFFLFLLILLMSYNMQD